jgi:hypothetical protein
MPAIVWAFLFLTGGQPADRKVGGFNAFGLLAGGRAGVLFDAAIS